MDYGKEEEIKSTNATYHIGTIYGSYGTLTKATEAYPMGNAAISAIMMS